MFCGKIDRAISVGVLSVLDLLASDAMSDCSKDGVRRCRRRKDERLARLFKRDMQQRVRVLDTLDG